MSDVEDSTDLLAKAMFGLYHPVEDWSKIGEYTQTAWHRKAETVK